MHPTAERFQERLRELGLDAEVQELADSTRTAKEAAAAVGVEVGQIVKSLVFVDDSGPLLCLCAGDRRVDTGKLGVNVRQADGDEVREATGYSIGGVPPVGHDRLVPMTQVDYRRTINFLAFAGEQLVASAMLASSWLGLGS